MAEQAICRELRGRAAGRYFPDNTGRFLTTHRMSGTHTACAGVCCPWFGRERPTGIKVDYVGISALCANTARAYNCAMRLAAHADPGDSLRLSVAGRFSRSRLVTTSLTYDADGNLAQKTVDGTTTTYLYDYANRLIALGTAAGTTTYAYDAFGNRVLQTGTTTTYLYPFKWVSVASSTGTGAKYATTTDYVFNADTLLATVDQQTVSGAATGTAKTRYVHPDHLAART